MAVTSISPEQLAYLFEIEGSVNPRLKSNVSLGGVDTMQVPISHGESIDFALMGGDGSGGRASSSVVVDLTGFTAVRFTTLVAVATTAANPVAHLLYSFDDSAMAFLTTNALDLSEVGLATTAWEDIPAAARAPVVVDINIDADETMADGSIVGVTAQFRR